MKKKLTALLMVALICVSATVPALAAAPVFQDVPDGFWAKAQIEKAYALGMVGGTSYNEATGVRTYSPNNPITGAQLMVMLVRRYCPQDVNAEMAHQCGFSGTWYDGEFYAADKHGYLNGLPLEQGVRAVLEAPASRELLVAMLYNVAGRPDDSGDAATVLAQFTDRTKVAAYAVDGFAWAVGNGIVSGTSATTLSPQGTATRAQVAVILIRYIEKSGDKVPVPEPQPEPQPTPTLEPKNADGTTNADYVNSISNHGKSNDYPTSGAANTANENGYFTKADVDIENATLQYDALEFLNAFLAENGKDPAMWTTSDEVEEYTMMRAKEAYVNFAHTRPDGGYNLTGENLYKGYGNASSVINAWDGSSSHHGTMIATSGNYVCIAKYGTCWVLTGWKVNGNGLDYVVKFAENNYSWE